MENYDENSSRKQNSFYPASLLVSVIKVESNRFQIIMKWVLATLHQYKE